MATTRKFEQITTPKGIAVFPRITKPDTKFKAEGKYSVKLRLSRVEAQSLIDKLEAALETLVAETKADYEEKLANAKTGKDKASIKKFLSDMPINDIPVKAAVDDEGNETDDVELSFTMPAQYTDKKTGKVMKLKPTLLDAKGKEITKAIEVWGGSIIRVGGTIRPYVTPKGVGVRLGLSLVKIIELVTGSGGASASSFGMDGDEGDFSGDDLPNQEAADPMAADESSAEDAQEATEY